MKDERTLPSLVLKAPVEGPILKDDVSKPRTLLCLLSANCGWDGSIVQGFLTEECISFYENFLAVEQPIGLPGNKHLGRFEGVGHKTGKREMHVDFEGRRTTLTGPT